MGVRGIVSVLLRGTDGMGMCCKGNMVTEWGDV